MARHSLDRGLKLEHGICRRPDHKAFEESITTHETTGPLFPSYHYHPPSSIEKFPPLLLLAIMSFFNNSTHTWAHFVWPWPCVPPTTFEFSQFAELDQAVIDPEIERRLDFINMFDEPSIHENRSELASEQPTGPLYPPGLHVGGVPLHNMVSDFESKVELIQPRPVRKIAIRNALAQFEDMANSSDNLPDLCNTGSLSDSSSKANATCPSSVKNANTHNILKKKHNPAEELDRLFPAARRQAKANAIGNSCFYPPGLYAPTPRPAQTNPAPIRPSGGRACLSPGFLENFEGHQRTQPPKPIFVFKRSQPREPTPPRQPTPSSSSSPEATYVRGHEIARLVREFGDIFVERDDLSFDKNESDSSWFDDEMDRSAIVDFNPSANDTFSTDGDGSFFLLDNSFSGHVANEDSYFADEESNSSESPCSSPVFSRASSPVSSPDSFIFNGPTIRLVQPTNPTDTEIMSPPDVDSVILLEIQRMRERDGRARNELALDPAAA
ncbi:hypothetical protein ACEPAH_7186 [Sanghuangporus vaninii]